MGKYGILFFTALPKFIKKHYQNLLIFFYRKLLAFLPKNGVTLPIFTLPKFTVTELNFIPFTAHYRYRFFQKIIYRPTPSYEPVHVTPEWPRANGMVERFNRSMKEASKLPTWKVKTSLKQPTNLLKCTGPHHTQLPTLAHLKPCTEAEK